MPTPTPTTTRDIKSFEKEIAELEDRRRDALAVARQAEERLVQIASRRTSLAAAAVAGDPAAVEEVSALEGEARELASRSQLVKTAVSEIEASIEATKADLEAARANEARARFEELAEQRHALDVEAEELVRELVGKLEEIRGVHRRMLAEAREADLGLYDTLNRNRPPLQSWLTNRLRPHLGLPTNEHWSRPLAEIDGFAKNPEG